VKSAWSKNTFFDNFNTFVNHLGYDKAPVAFGLAMADWTDTDERDKFLFEITGRKVGEPSNVKKS